MRCYNVFAVIVLLLMLTICKSFAYACANLDVYQDELECTCCLQLHLFLCFYLLGQGGKFEQFLISVEFPNELQFFPPYLGAGASQYLLHSSIPWSQVESHLLLSVQLP